MALSLWVSVVESLTLVVWCMVRMVSGVET